MNGTVGTKYASDVLHDEGSVEWEEPLQESAVERVNCGGGDYNTDQAITISRNNIMKGLLPTTTASRASFTAASMISGMVATTLALYSRHTTMPGLACTVTCSVSSCTTSNIACHTSSQVSHRQLLPTGRPGGDCVRRYCDTTKFHCRDTGLHQELDTEAVTMRDVAEDIKYELFKP